ncbi:MAG: class I SAM-dependent methyltransferase [Thermoproteota archaeon]|nr:class I SAM-dependent methyltransferase [Thermoproteota archaeon]
MWKRIQREFRLRISDKFAERKGLVVDLPSHTVEINRDIWNNKDWSQMGEEWGPREAGRHEIDNTTWKKNLLDQMMFRYIKPNSVILEIGPGAGRWTQYLQPLANQLIIADIAVKCLQICKQRFTDKTNIDYKLIESDNIDFISSNSVDYVWSYDVFVHINPSDIERYVRNFGRILKKGGIGIIHHAGGKYVSYEEEKEGFRSKMTAETFKTMVEGANMKVIEQNRDLVHKKGDIITVFVKS